jgi:uncharacterized protein YeaO (DUF488 family)
MSSADINLRTKSVQSAIAPEADGLRILATRFRGRGLDPARYNVWMANLGPSEKLLRALQEGRMTWAAFAREYQKELFLDGGVDEGNETIKNHGQKFTLRLIKQLAAQQPVTLLCHCAEDQMQCHRHLLKKIILSNAV